MAENSKKIIDKFEMNVDPKDKIRNLPIAMQAMVTISKISVNNDIRVVIFDEPPPYWRMKRWKSCSALSKN